MLRSDGVRGKCEAVHAFFIYGLSENLFVGEKPWRLHSPLKYRRHAYTTQTCPSLCCQQMPWSIGAQICVPLNGTWRVLHKLICLTWTSHSGKWNGIATKFGTNNWGTTVHLRTNIRITEFFLPQKHCRNQTTRELIKTNPWRVILCQRSFIACAYGEWVMD